ncbi:MAG TPA: tetratricopeptide repeat protein [Trichormus sp.]|jgi:tetratricopeptide (TPR) repeat protein
MTSKRVWLKLILALAVTMPFAASPQSEAQAGPWVQKNLEAKSLYLNGDYSAAEKNWLEALEMARNIAPGDPRVAETLSQLGLLYERTGRYEEAATMLRSAILIKQNIYGENSPEIKDDLFSYSNALKKVGEEPDAIDAEKRAIKIAPADEHALGDTIDSEEANATTTSKSVNDWLDKTRSAIAAHHMLTAQVYALAALKQRNHDGGSGAEPVAMIGDVIHRLVQAGNARSAELLADRALTEVQDYRGLQHTEVAYVLTLRANALRALGQQVAAEGDEARANHIYVKVAEGFGGETFKWRPILNTDNLARLDVDARRAGGPFFLPPPRLYNHPTAFKSTSAMIRYPGHDWDDLDAMQAQSSMQLSDEELENQRIQRLEEQELQNLHDRERAAEAASVYSHYMPFSRIRSR